MIVKKVSLVVTLLFLATAALSGCAGREEIEELPDVPLKVNLLKNPSFEEWNGNIPVGWELTWFSGKGKTMNMYGKSTKERYSGKSSFFLRGLFNTDRWMTLTQRHPVIPGYVLKVKGYLKPQKIKRNKGQDNKANFYVIFYDEHGERVKKRYYADLFTHHRTGTGDWAMSRKKVDIPKGARTAEFGVVNTMTGRLFVDDVEMWIEMPVPWKKKETKYVTYFYLEEHPFPKGAIEEETDLIERSVKKLDLKMDEKIKYYYYGTEEMFMKILVLRQYRQRALWKMKELHTIDPTEDHAMLHLLLAPLGRPPVGLSKGIVFNLQGSLEGKDIDSEAKKFLVQMKIPALYKTIDLNEFKASNTSIIVPAWTSFCKYLMDRFGEEKIMELYERTNEVVEVGPFNEHFRDIYGKDFPDMDREWRLWLIRQRANWEVDTLQ